MTGTVQRILTKAADYVSQATGAVVSGTKSAYIALKTAVTSSDAPIKGAEIERTGVATTADNAGKVLAHTDTVMQQMMGNANFECNVTDFFSKYITSGTNVAATSFNASLALADFEEAYENEMAIAS